MWDLRSLTGDWTCTPALTAWSLNHWTAREVLDSGGFVWAFETSVLGGQSPILVPSLLTWLAVVPVIYQSQTVCLCPEGNSGSTLWQGSSPQLALLRTLLLSHKLQHCMSATTWEAHLAAPDPCLPFSGVAGNRGCPLLPVLRAHIEQSSRTVAAFGNLPDSAGLHFIGAYHSFLTILWSVT